MKKILLLTAAVATAVVSACSQNIPSYVPTDGLVGWWPFNGNANDESGNGNNGTVNGATLSFDRNGIENMAYRFSGSQNIIVQHNEIFNMGSNYTISIWFTVDDFNNVRTLINKNAIGNGNTDYFNIGILPNTGLLYTQFGNGSLIDNIVCPTAPNLNTWYNGTLTVSDDVKFFLNGQIVESHSANIMPLENSENISFGYWQTQNHTYHYGNLDDIGIWNRALTESEIQQLYEGCNVQDIAISGNNTPAALQSATYTCNGDAGSTYTWSVTNGVITSGQGTNSVNVVWAETGFGSISVQETTSVNCTGELITLDVVVIPTSVNELSAPEICIYPNPASNRLSIAQDASFYGKSYTIYNAAGSLVHSGKLVGGVTSLSLEEFATGQYTLHVEGSSPKNFAVVKE